MSRARRNPIGLPKPPGTEIVRVGSGEHTHIYNPDTGLHLCESGIGSDKREPTLYHSDAEFVTCYRCVKMLAKVPDIQRTFAPSYDAKTLNEYAKKLRRGKKKFKHRQIRGGRSAARKGGAGLFTPSMRRESINRLESFMPPWEARTQSPEVWAYTQKRMGEARPNPRGKIKPAERRLINQIQEGLKNYQKQQKQDHLGLYVPPFAGPLIEAGVPRKAAYILVGRAGNRFISDLPNAYALGQDPFTIPEQLVEAIGTFPEVVFVGQDARIESATTGHLERIDVEGKPYLSTAQIEELFYVWRKAEPKTDKDQFVRDFFQALEERLGSGRANELDLYFSKLKRPVEVDLLSLQHSDVAPKGAKSPPIGYRKLENISLSDLPYVLANITRRTKREGRKLPKLHSNTSLENPMSYWENQYNKGPYGGRQSLPAARRNRGRPRTSTRTGRRTNMEVDADNRPLLRESKSSLESIIRRGGKDAKHAKQELAYRQLLRGSSSKSRSKRAGKKTGLSEWQIFLAENSGKGWDMKKMGKEYRKKVKKAKKSTSSSKRKSSSRRRSGRRTTWPKFQKRAAKAGLTRNQTSAAWKKYKAGKGTLAELLNSKSKKKTSSSKKRNSSSRRKSSSRRRSGRRTTWPKFQKRAAKAGLTRSQTSAAWKKYKAGKGTMAELLKSKSGKKTSSSKKTGRRGGYRVPRWHKFLKREGGKGYSMDELRAMYAYEKATGARANPADLTHVQSALGPARHNPDLDPPGGLWFDEWHPNYEQAIGQFSVGESWSDGIQPTNRRNPSRRKSRKSRKRRKNPQAAEAMELYHSGVASSLGEAWDIVKGR